MSDSPAPQPASSVTRVVELVVNLDDVSGEVIGDATQTLLAEGALDVWTTPIQMKKQRPGVMLSVLSPAEPPEAARATAKRILELTGSFGVRFRGWDRLVLERQHVELDTRFGSVSVKVGRLDGQVINATPEFASVRALAEQAGVAVREVMDAARGAADEFRVSAAGRGAG